MTVNDPIDSDRDEAVYPLTVNELLSAVFVRRHDRLHGRIGMEQDDRDYREKDIPLDRMQKLQFRRHVGFAPQNDCADRKLLAKTEQRIKPGEVMKGDILLAIELL